METRGEFTVQVSTDRHLQRQSHHRRLLAVLWNDTFERSSRRRLELPRHACLEYHALTATSYSALRQHQYAVRPVRRSRTGVSGSAYHDEDVIYPEQVPPADDCSMYLDPGDNKI